MPSPYTTLGPGDIYERATDREEADERRQRDREDRLQSAIDAVEFGDDEPRGQDYLSDYYDRW
jgi:hypothetical protein